MYRLPDREPLPETFPLSDAHAREVVEWWREAAYTVQAERDELAGELRKAERAMRDYAIREAANADPLDMRVARLDGWQGAEL